MRSSFKVSLVCNLCLAAVLVFILARQQKNSPAHTSIEPAPASAIAPAPPVESKPFQWSQIESTNDYRDYVANLRSIGCPEPTVEDIVWGDAERAFSHQRHDLNLNGDEPGPWSKQREAQMVAFFLGQGPAPVESNQENVSAVAAGPKSASPIYPLAFRDVNLDKLGLTEAQKQGVQQAIAGLRQQFIEQIGGLNQDPSDPTYLQRWQKAQPQADAR